LDCPYYHSLFTSIGHSNKIEEISSVVYDISSKPPATIDTSSSVVALAKKVAKPKTKTITRIISIPQTKVVKQPQQTLEKHASQFLDFC